MPISGVTSTGRCARARSVSTSPTDAVLGAEQAALPAGTLFRPNVTPYLGGKKNDRTQHQRGRRGDAPRRGGRQREGPARPVFAWGDGIEAGVGPANQLDAGQRLPAGGSRPARARRVRRTGW